MLNLLESLILLCTWAKMIMPPLKKVAYCFATVGMSVGRSVPQWVDDPYWISGHMFKGQSQTTFFSPLYCQYVQCSISFDPFTWSIPNLVRGLRPVSRWSILIIRSHVQRSRSNHSWVQCVVCSISFDPFTWSIPNLVRGLNPCLVHISSNFELCTKGA